MRILLLSICVCYVLILSGQAIEVANTTSSFDKIRNNLEQITHEYIDRSLLMQDYPQDVEILETIYAPPTGPSDFKHLFTEYRQADLTYNEPTNGLSFSGGYLHNIKGSILEEDGFFYLNRWQAELDWNLLKGGLLNEKSSFEIDKIQYTIDSLQLDERINHKVYGSIFDYIIYLFNALKIQLVQRHQHLLDKELEVAYQLYYQKYIHWEEVLTLMSKKAEVDVAVKNYINYNQQVEFPFSVDATSLKRLPLIGINFQLLESVGCDTLLHNKITELELEKDRVATKWKYKPSLSTYLRYNKYSDPGTSGARQRDFIAGGLQLKVPLVSRKKAADNRLKAKAQWLAMENTTYFYNVRNEMLNHYYEYEYTHRQFIHFYHKKLLAINQINRELSKRQLNDPGYSALEIARHLDDLYSLDLELLDIQQKMYLKLLKIFRFVPQDQWKSFVQPEEITHLFAPYHETHKMKIDAETFNSHNSEYVLAYLQKNSIQNAIVDSDMYKQFAKEVGSDINSSIRVDAKAMINGAFTNLDFESNVQNIYLDIPRISGEDQVVNDYKAYMDLASTLKLKHALNIAVPITNDKNIIKDLAGISKKITLKISENNDPDFIAEKILSMELSSDIEIQAELSCDAFLDRFQFEEFVQLLKEKSAIKSIVISDFNQLLELEANTIQLYEKQRF